MEICLQILATVDTTVAFTVVSGGGSVSTARNNRDGTYTATYTAGTAMGEVKIEAKTSNGKVATVTLTLTKSESGGLTRGTFNLTLTEGLNMISLPVETDMPYTAKRIADELDATVVIRLDVKTGQFDPYIPGFSKGDGFSLEGGQGYIVNVLAAKQITFTGVVWDNVNASPIHPSTHFPTHPAVWAFAIVGTAAADRPNTGIITVRNLRTGEILSEVYPFVTLRAGSERSRRTQDDSYRYAVAFADLSRRGVVEAGDVLEIDGKYRYIVTTDDLRRAFAQIDLRPDLLLPAQTALLQNYPNPFNPETWIPYHLADPVEVMLSIYDARGRLLRTLAIGQQMAGFYVEPSKAAYWDGRNAWGETVASGVYFYQFTAGNFTATRRMVIRK